jgi:hypothetical protein
MARKKIGTNDYKDSTITPTQLSGVSGATLSYDGVAVTTIKQKIDAIVAGTLYSENNFVGDGTTVTFTLSGTLNTLVPYFVIVNGQEQKVGASNDFTLQSSNTEVVFNYTPENNLWITVKYVKA